MDAIDMLKERLYQKPVVHKSVEYVFPDSELQRFLDVNDGNIYGATAEAVEHMAIHPMRYRQWTDIRLTHYDLLEIAKYQRKLQVQDREETGGNE